MFALGVVGVLLAAAAPFLLKQAAGAPNLSFAIEQSAPLSGKALAVLQRSLPRSQPMASAVSPLPAAASGPLALPAHSGIDLRGRDVLVITIDALRADRLKAYGGRANVTPVLDALASESVVFTRAYTQTPHTSYAIGSLLTGKYLRPVLSLPQAPREHATLPRLLRRYGYRTAGFYPPAVFFVDEERFSALSEDHFGFEYVKEMFAKAPERVSQLEDYMAQADPKHSVLAWVHLFEPHEPYERHAEHDRGEEPEQRYDSEVLASDAAVADLIRVFRAKRPNATVIVSADHGEEFGDHGGYHHGTTLFEEQVRVPLLWSSPGQATPRVVEAPVELIDIVPTLLASLGIPRDVRMLGDDLSGVLAGAAAPASLRAFASIEEQRMWTNGRWKAICENEDGRCRLFDLSIDPGERRDLSAQQPAILTALRGELSVLLASLPNVEAMAMGDGGSGWPEALARARLGDASVGPALLPLLGDERMEVREEAARAVATLGLRDALGVLRTLRVQDPENEVRAEAALAALTLGDDGALAQVEEMFALAKAAGAPQLELARRAALALARLDPEKSRDVLLALVQDEAASEGERLRALRALGTRRDRQTVRVLIELLADVRLRVAVARQLGEIGGRLAQDALARALAEERYPEARAAEVEALAELHDRRAKPLLLRMLGTETGVPGGLALWHSLGGPFAGTRGLLFDLRKAAGQGSDTPPGITNAQEWLRGRWDCSDGATGCRPGADPLSSRPSQIVLRGGVAPRTQARMIVDLVVTGVNEQLEIDGERFSLRAGEHTIGLALRKERGERTIELRSSTGLTLRRFGIVPQEDDVPPPAPEPYDAGTE
jgi:arylsulfatase A-like enzyme/HEAT repeat protein